jgi:hypothetical protein
MTALRFTIILLALPLLAWLPGWLMWRGFATEHRGQLSTAEWTFFCLFASLVTTAVVAVLLAELSGFSLVALLTGVAGLCLILAGVDFTPGRTTAYLNLSPAGWSRGVRRSLARPRGAAFGLGLLAVVGLAAGLFLRPAESILVFDDSAVYTIRAITLARTGALDIRDPLLADITPELAGAVLPFRYGAGYMRHESFYIWQWGPGVVRPSFFHLPSIWMAAAALFGGDRAAIWAVPLVGLVAVAAFAVLVRRLFGTAVALAAALLLTVSFPQVAYARYPTSEIFMQAWLLAGLWLLAVFVERRLRLAGVVAGIALGQLAFIRIDAWVAAVAVGLCFGIWAIKDGRRGPEGVGDRWFLVPFAAMGAWGMLHAALYASPYIISLMHFYLSPRAAGFIVLGVVLAAASAVLALLRAQGVMGPLPWPSLPVSQRISTVLLAGAWVTLALGATAAGDLGAVQWLSWYLTPLVLLLALAGSALLWQHGVRRPAQVFLLTALLYAVLYLPAPRAYPVQPWAIRRFVPTVLPGLILLVAYFLVRVPLWGPARAQQLLRVAGVIALAGVLANPTRVLARHAEYAGAWDEVEGLARELQPGAVLLFNRTGVGEALAQPLTYLYGRPSYVVEREEPDLGALEELANTWMDDGRPVYFAISELAPWLAGLQSRLKPAGQLHLGFPRLERTQDGVPSAITAVDWSIDLYRLERSAVDVPVRRLEMGAGELSYLVGGFYEREVSPAGETYRWTDGAADLRLPVQRTVQALALRVAGPPPAVAPATVTLLVDGVVAGRWEQANGFDVRRVELPGGAADDGWLDVELRSATWVPSAAGVSDDDRQLGIVLDWIEVGP